MLYKQQALDIITARLLHFNVFYNFSYKKISIRNQKTRWGSCSRKGNLQFNYKIAFLKPELQDYIIVHELCHLGEFNHSSSFWKLVEHTIPDHRVRRNELKKVFSV